MRNFKFLATTIVAVMLACVLAVASFAATTPFKDVDDKNEALSDAVSLLNGLGVAKGTSDTTFGTMDLVTRQQMSAFIYRLMKSGKSMEGGTNATSFKDLEDSTYFGYISWANATGVIKGTSDTTFNPKGGITLQDAYTMVIRALGHEDDTYEYPFTYIDKAEELGLDVGLDSVVNYTTKLTRGDVAIILSNAFFAETGFEEVEQVERLIGGGKKWVLEKKTYNPTLAEYAYDVEVGNFEVRATPKYAFNESEDATDYAPLCDDYEVDMLHLVAADENEALSEIFCEFASTGLTGAADDYIMTGVQVFYTVEEKDGKNKLNKLYYVSGSHKVLETNSATGYYVSGTDAPDYYYTENPNHKYKKVEGYVSVNNEPIYFFDAPYSYLKPDYNSLMSIADKDELEEARYELRNEKNVKLINIKCLDLEKGTYSYYVDEDAPINTPEDAIKNLQRIYSRGVYKIKFFDIDADGIYEYAHYMPATYGFMDGDDDKFFSTEMEDNAPIRVPQKGSDIDVSFVPTIYYNDAKISGAKFNDGDFAIAYLNPEANMIEVMATVKPYNGYASYIRTAHGMFKIDNTTFSTAYVYRTLDNFYDDDASNWNEYHNDANFYRLHEWSDAQTFPKLINQKAVGEVFDIYAYKVFGYNHILWYDHLDDSSIAFGLDELAIPVGNKDNVAETYTKSQFDATLGEGVEYAKVYLGGKVSYIPLDIDEMYPELDAGYEAGKYNLASITGQGGYRAYVDKICKVKKNANGQYALIPLLHAEDDDGEYIGINRDSATLIEEDNNKQFGMDLDYEVEAVIKKIAGTRYELVDVATGDTLLGDPFGGDGITIKYFNITSATRIVIKNTISGGDNEVEYLEFDASSFKGTTSEESPLTNIQYILKGDPESTNRADLVLLYAEAVDFEFEVKGIKNGWRVVVDAEIAADENGDYRNFYKLFNPYTGAYEEDVAGDIYEEDAGDLEDAVANGTVVELKNGLVDEEGDALAVIDTASSAGLVYITEYDETEGYMGFVPVEAIEAAIADGTIACGCDLEVFADTYKYYGDELNFDGEEFKTTIDADDEPIYGTALYYEITEDTVISVFTSKKPGFKNGEFKLADINAIAKNSKEFKCYNDMVLNRKGVYGTEYAKYVKAYVYASKDATNEDTLPVAEYVIVVVNGDENLIFTDHDDNFLPA